MLLAKVVLGLTLLFSISEAKKNYDGYKVYRFQVTTEAETEALQTLERSGIFDFWTDPVQGRNADVMTSPTNEKILLSFAAKHGLSHSGAWIQDVQALAALSESSSTTEKSDADHPMTWTEYHSLEDIYKFFDYLEETYDFVSTESIGRSFEGNDMRVIKVCKGGCSNKPAMWIDGGIHAREWISPATVTWMLNELVENDADHPELTENLDWYFLASHNPDGYRFSREQDRMWRKTRTQYPGEQTQYNCYGTDANRNFDFHWAEAGSSDYSCSETFHGPEPFSEIEAVNVRDFVLKNKDNIKFFNTIHSYSQLILFPWGYTTTPVPDYDAMLDLGQRGNDALFDVHGKYYEVGCIPCVLYTAAGTSLDWAYGVAGVPYVYSIELRDTGSYGFLLPPTQIIPTAEETWAFHLVAAEQIIMEFGKQ